MTVAKNNHNGLCKRLKTYMRQNNLLFNWNHTSSYKEEDCEHYFFSMKEFGRRHINNGDEVCRCIDWLLAFNQCRMSSTHTSGKWEELLELRTYDTYNHYKCIQTVYLLQVDPWWEEKFIIFKDVNPCLQIIVSVCVFDLMWGLPQSAWRGP